MTPPGISAEDLTNPILCGSIPMESSGKITVFFFFGHFDGLSAAPILRPSQVGRELMG
jgi:hypothetical protein